MKRQTIFGFALPDFWRRASTHGTDRSIFLSQEFGERHAKVLQLAEEVAKRPSMEIYEVDDLADEMFGFQELSAYEVMTAVHIVFEQSVKDATGTASA
jgi:hypothetical protein